MRLGLEKFPGLGKGERRATEPCHQTGGRRQFDGAIAALSVVPVCFTATVQPTPPKAQPLALVEQFATAPAAVIASFGAGLVNGGVLALAPLYAAQHYGPNASAEFYSAAFTGSLLLQWPAGRASDRVDRRLIIAGLAGLAAVSALALALWSGHLDSWSAVLLFFLWGAGALSFYGIAVAHMADRAEPGRLAQSDLLLQLAEHPLLRGLPRLDAALRELPGVLVDALAPENFVFPVDQYDSDVRAISITIDHVNHPTIR